MKTTFFLIISLATPLTLANTHRVSPDATASVKAFEICRKVTNRNGQAVMVPTKTHEEWQRFRNLRRDDIIFSDCSTVINPGIFACGSHKCWGDHIAHPTATTINAGAMRASANRICEQHGFRTAESFTWNPTATGGGVYCGWNGSSWACDYGCSGCKGYYETITCLD